MEKWRKNILKYTPVVVDGLICSYSTHLIRVCPDGRIQLTGGDI